MSTRGFWVCSSISWTATKAARRLWFYRWISVRIFHIILAGGHGYYNWALMMNNYCLVGPWTTFLMRTPSAHGMSELMHNFHFAWGCTGARGTVFRALSVKKHIPQACSSDTKPSVSWLVGLLFASVKVWVKEHAGDIVVLCPHVWAPRLGDDCPSELDQETLNRASPKGNTNWKTSDRRMNRLSWHLIMTKQDQKCPLSWSYQLIAWLLTSKTKLSLLKIQQL